ncbi:MAG: DUF1186 domain-containing protein [Burkholderiales bacterium]|nr:DUF1186 domain-containing protein [Burkholderiales bacterium]
MQWHDIRSALSRMSPPFPLAAAQQARQRWDELAPFFIAELERVAAGGSTLRGEMEEEYDGLFSFAAYLAAEKRDTRAYAPLVRTCHCSGDRADELFADDAGIQLGRMLASVCDGELAPIKALAEDRGTDLWCRYAALRALVVRVLEGDADRDSVLAYIEALCVREANVLRQPDEVGERDDFLTWAIDAASELGPAPLLEAIRGWFGEGLIDPSVTPLKWFEQTAAMPVQDYLAEAAANEENRYMRDALDEMAGWMCYDLHESSHSGGTMVRDRPKVGRNDPCPCGSGKKFKKCCGKQANEPAADVGTDGGVGKAITWLTSRHAKAVKTSIATMLYAGLDKEEQAKLQDLDEHDWEGVQINAMEWLLAEGSIAVKGMQRNVAELLLGPGGPAFAPGQRSWIEQLRRRPLRLYTITEVLPGTGMRLCDALDTEATPVMVHETSGSAHARIGSLIGVRIMELDGHREISGAAYSFSHLMNAALLAQLQAAADDAAVQGEELSHRLSAVIRHCWIAQYAKPLPLPTVIDSHSGDPILLITDHYRVKDWDGLAAALKTQSDVEGERASGWARRFECADGQTRQSVSINLGKSEDRIELFYKTQNYADQGRPWFEALAGKSVEFAGRVLSDPRNAMKNPPTGKTGSSVTTVPNLPPEVLAVAIEQALHRSYANWSDEPIPALGGKTPRQALATAAGRERVRGLLRSYEAGEKAQAAQQGRREISYAFLWEALGLDRASP